MASAVGAVAQINPFMMAHYHGIRLNGQGSDPFQLLQNNTRSVNDLIPVNDSIVHWQWDNITDDWGFYSRTIDIVYDEDYNMIESTTQVWDGGAWVNQMQSSTSYPDNVTIIILSKMWDGESWVNFMQYITEMDPATHTNTFTFQMWSGTSWMNQSRTIVVYDDYDNIISAISQSWSGGNWMNVYRTTNDYNANHYIMTSTLELWMSNQWVNNTSSLYTYYANNNLSGRTMYMWESNNWERYTLDTLFTYDGGNNNTGYYTMMWTGQWENSTRSTYTYNTHNDLLSSTVETWMGSDWILTSHTIGAYSYDANGFTEGQSNKDLDAITGAVVTGDSTHYYFHTVVSAGDIPVAQNLSVYPNPTNGSFTIDASGITGSIKTVNLYNLKGELISTVNNALKAGSMNISGIPKGVYLLKVETGARRYLSKIVVL